MHLAARNGVNISKKHTANLTQVCQLADAEGKTYFLRNAWNVNTQPPPSHDSANAHPWQMDPSAKIFRPVVSNAEDARKTPDDDF